MKNYRDPHARAQSRRDRADRPWAMPHITASGGRTRRMAPYARPRAGGGTKDIDAPWGPRVNPGPLE